LAEFAVLDDPTGSPPGANAAKCHQEPSCCVWRIPPWIIQAPMSTTLSSCVLRIQ